MIGSTWNALFITMAMGAGMFAQQAAHKVSVGNEDRQIGSLAGMELFCSAEGYYLAGRYSAPANSRGSQNATPTTDEAPVLTLADARVGASGEPMAPAREIEDPVVELATSAPAVEVLESPMISEPSPVTIVSPETRDPESAEPSLAHSHEQPESLGMGPASDSLLPELAASTPAGGDVAEVLPPPLPDDRFQVPGDGFDPLAAPSPHLAPRTPLPPTVAMAAARRDYDATPGHDHRYVTPADLVRERALARGEQRHHRIETRKWLGISPLRPSVGATPYTTVDEPQLLLLVPNTAPRGIR